MGIQFGRTTIGSQDYPTAEFGDNTTHNQDNTTGVWAQKAVLPEPGTIVKMRIYLHNADSGKFAIYAHDSQNDCPTGYPLVTTGLYSLGAGWNEVDIGPIFLNAGTYWLAWWKTNSVFSTSYGSKSGAKFYLYTGYAGSDWPQGGAWNLYTNYCFTLTAKYVKIKGYIKATKAVLSTDIGRVDKLYFYSHEAGGNIRLAIYDANKQLLWQGGPYGITSAGWQTIPISSGYPVTLSLPAGTYWLAWQYDAAARAPSYAAGASGDGWYKAQGFGSFPSSISGETSSAEVWSIYGEGTQYGTADLPASLIVRMGGFADLPASLVVRAEGAPKDLWAELFIGIKDHVIFGQYDFPGVQRIERADTDLFVEKPIPGRQKAYRASIGALGRICRIEGRVRPADPRAFIAELEAMADGAARWLYDGLCAYKAIMRKPRFRLASDQPCLVEYEVEFAEQENP